MRLIQRLRHFTKLTGLSPVSRHWGFDRGKSPDQPGLPIDRYYVEKFLEENAADIKGYVLEIGDLECTKKFGREKVEVAEILDADINNQAAHYFCDLAVGGKDLPTGRFDSFLLIQTLLLIYDVKSAIINAKQTLKPDGILLVTLPGISKICRPEMEMWGDYWRFTSASVTRLFSDVFGQENVQVKTFGNVLSASAFLYGLAAHELTQKELDYHDPDFQVTLAIRAVNR